MWSNHISTSTAAWAQEVFREAMGLLHVAWSMVFCAFPGGVPRGIASELTQLALVTDKILGVHVKGVLGTDLDFGLPPDAPQIPIALPSALVVFKPSGWHILCASRAWRASSLSHLLQAAWPGPRLPVLHEDTSDWAFSARLDMPSTGLILVATDFQGMFAHQYQAQTYSISRCYAVMLVEFCGLTGALRLLPQGPSSNLAAAVPASTHASKVSGATIEIAIASAEQGAKPSHSRAWSWVNGVDGSTWGERRGAATPCAGRRGPWDGHADAEAQSRVASSSFDGRARSSSAWQCGRSRVSPWQIERGDDMSAKAAARYDSPWVPRYGSARQWSSGSRSGSPWHSWERQSEDWPSWSWFGNVCRDSAKYDTADQK